MLVNVRGCFIRFGKRMKSRERLKVKRMLETRTGPNFHNPTLTDLP